MTEGIPVKNYQEQQELAEASPKQEEFAVVAQILSDGVVLTFGAGTEQEETTNKAYQTNSGIKFKVGDKVKLDRVAGSYLAAYPVGAPKISNDADYAARAGSADDAVKLNGKTEGQLSVSYAESADFANACTTANELRSADGYNRSVKIRKNGDYIQIGYAGVWYNLIKTV